jgi:hypothetical protein
MAQQTSEKTIESLITAVDAAALRGVHPKTFCRPVGRRPSYSLLKN